MFKDCVISDAIALVLILAFVFTMFTGSLQLSQIVGKITGYALLPLIVLAVFEKRHANKKRREQQK
jgi:hypothetical protein